MFGVGIDIVEVQDIDVDKLYKVFSNCEREYVDASTNFDRRRDVVAGIFAGKEAVFKALKLDSLGLQVLRDIEIRHHANGCPFVCYKGKVASNIELSISHTRLTAVAVAFCLGELPVPLEPLGKGTRP